MRTRLLLLLAALAAALAPRRAAAAVAFEPALWNSYARYEADNVPARLLLPQGQQQTGPVLFPLDGGWNVQARARPRGMLLGALGGAQGGRERRDLRACTHNTYARATLTTRTHVRTDRHARTHT
jgi:hypothetical protein